MSYELSTKKTAIVLDQAAMLALNGNKEGALAILETMDTFSKELGFLAIMLRMSIDAEIEREKTAKTGKEPDFSKAGLINLKEVELLIERSKRDQRRK